MIRIAAAAALLLLLAIAALFVITQHLRRSTMFVPERYPAGRWDPAGLPVAPRDVLFQASDGTHLHGWMFDAGRGSPLAIWFHGNAGNITGRAPIASELARRGISIFVFDYRGYGRSDGVATEEGATLDSLAAYDAVAADRPGTIVLYGESLGGPFAAWTATKRRADCIVIENSFSSLARLGNVLYHPFPVGWFASGALTTTRWLNEAGLPVLVMHGKPDQVIPFALGMDLYNGLRVPKELLVSEIAQHDAIAFVESERYYSTVTDFIRRMGKPG
jgi:alpha-beta hydrolase superfamily lysophospholipase